MVGAPAMIPGFPSLPPALHHLHPGAGLLSAEDFSAEIGKSIALVGIGDPPLSPSPYDALVRSQLFSFLSTSSPIDLNSSALNL